MVEQEAPECSPKTWLQVSCKKASSHLHHQKSHLLLFLFHFLYDGQKAHACGALRITNLALAFTLLEYEFDGLNDLNAAARSGLKALEGSESDK